MGKIICDLCKKSCKTQAIKLEERYFHVACFICKGCKKQLSPDGFYLNAGDLYCNEDYEKLFGTKCHCCGKYLEGEVITALGYAYHDNCFRCTKCDTKFEPGDKVTFSGSDALCVACFESRISGSGNKIIDEVAEDCEKETSNSTKDIFSEDYSGINSNMCEVNFGKFYQASYLDKTSDFKRGPSLNSSGVDRSPKHYHRPDNFSYSSVLRDFIKPPKRETSLLLTSLDQEMPPPSRSKDMFMPITNREPVRLAKLPDGHLREKNLYVGSEEKASSSSGSIASDHQLCERSSDVLDGSKELKSNDDNHETSEKDLTDGFADDCEKVSSNNDSLLTSDVSAKVMASSYDGIEIADEGQEEKRKSARLSSSFTEEFDQTTGLRKFKGSTSCLSTSLGSYRNSLPSLFKVEERAKIYPYEQLKNNNFKLPPGVERSTVERHLSKAEFENLFRMSRDDFYQLAEWKRNDLKKRIGLF